MSTQELLVLSQEMETWLTRFAAGAGSTYQWQLRPYTHLDGSVVYELRAVTYKQDTGICYMCPISAQATLESGFVLSASAWYKAMRMQGIGRAGVADEILRAADDSIEATPSIRQRLLRICGLTEHDTL